MRYILLFLIWGGNIALFALSIYIYYFAATQRSIVGLVIGGIAMLIFVTLPGTEYILNQIHKEKIE